VIGGRAIGAISYWSATGRISRRRTWRIAPGIQRPQSRTSESSQDSRSLVLKMMCRMTLLSDWGMTEMMIELAPKVNRAFSAGDFEFH